MEPPSPTSGNSVSQAITTTQKHLSVDTWSVVAVKYDEGNLRGVHMMWIVSWMNFSIYATLTTLFVCGVSLQKYKNKSTKRLEDWIAVLAGRFFS